MRIISWNVNGIRAIQKKGFLEWFKKEAPEILCLQETKADSSQLAPELKNISGYSSYWANAEKKGYSGVVTYSKNKPLKVTYGFSEPENHSEGRIVITEFKEFVLLNIYFPNGKKNQERLNYKMAFYMETLAYCEHLKKQGKKIIICGDVNTAHREIDLARPRENAEVSGFLPQERAWIDELLDQGYVDTLRYLNKSPELYTWWDYKTKARERNVGWRIDYFFISKDLLPNLQNAFILDKVYGSDHCPIGIEVNL